MALSRVALLLGVSRVSGFSSSPMLASRSAGDPGKCVNPDCDADSVNLCKSSQNAYDGANKKVCFINGFCYYRKGNYCNCEYYGKACDGAPTSSDCSNHQSMVAKGSCPALQLGDVSDFCSTLDTKKALASGEWCYDVKGETECNAAYVTYTSGPTGQESYQSCTWNANKGKCRLYKKSGYDVTVFCDSFCKVDKSGMFDLGTTKCNQGRLDDASTYGLANRLSSQSACEGTYYSPTTTIDNGCEWLAGTARCDPSFYCDADAIANGNCHPACNCQPYLTAGCGPTPVMCCDANDCTPCDDLDPPVAYENTVY